MATKKLTSPILVEIERQQKEALEKFNKCKTTWDFLQSTVTYFNTSGLTERLEGLGFKLSPHVYANRGAELIISYEGEEQVDPIAFSEAKELIREHFPDIGYSSNETNFWRVGWYSYEGKNSVNMELYGTVKCKVTFKQKWVEGHTVTIAEYECASREEI